MISFCFPSSTFPPYKYPSPPLHLPQSQTFPLQTKLLHSLLFLSAMAATISTIFLISLSNFFLIMSLGVESRALTGGLYGAGPWQTAHATFYGGNDASGTMGILKISISFSKSITISLYFKTLNTFFFALFCRRGVRLWQLVQPRLRREHGGAQHSSVQRRLQLRGLF